MIRHDRSDYAVATSSASKAARDKLQGIIDNGKAKAGNVVETVRSRVIQDKIVRTKFAQVVPIQGMGFSLALPDGGRPLHHHAFNQVIADAGVPKKFVDEIVGQANGTPWGAELAAHNINTIFAHRDSQRNLVRLNDERVMGFLSDKFRRLDSRPLLEAFAGAAQKLGLVAIDGVATDTRVRLRAVFPEVFEPIDNEVMVFGLEWGNSDYGHGGHMVNLWTMRIWCTNLAITDQVLRQVHLGARLPDDIAFSEATYKKDTEATVSALKDVVGHAISPARVNAMCQVIKDASDREIKDVGAILKKHLDKADVERVVAAYESPDVVNLPPGNNLWRLSNAVSWIAQGKDVSDDRKLELQHVAGELVPHKKIAAQAA